MIYIRRLSAGTCSCVCMHIHVHAVAISAVLQFYSRHDFYYIKIKHKLYIALTSVPCSPHQTPPKIKNSRCAPGATDLLGYIPKDSLTFYEREELCHNKNVGKELKRRLSPPRIDYWIVDALRYNISVRHEVCTRNDITEILPGDRPHQRSGKTCSYTIIGVVWGKAVKSPLECSDRYGERLLSHQLSIEVVMGKGR